jgi:hypothetical protein
VLVYVQPGCRLCDVMLSAIDGAHEQLAGRVTVIVGGATTADIEAISQRYSRLPASAWHGDVGMTAFKRLAMPGTPFLMGVRGRDVEWTLSGVLADSDTVQSVLRSWIAKN